MASAAKNAGDRINVVRSNKADKSGGDKVTLEFWR